MIRCVLLDIEGTTTDINFVHQVLFPYSEENLRPFIEVHGEESEVKQAIQDVRKTVQQEEGRIITHHEAIEVLLRWIAQDRKHTALKALQGMIWKAGYEQGQYRSHIYPEVPEALDRWKAMGLELAIYSSGSVAAQKLLFRYTVYGDLTPKFSSYFDTLVGGKKEAGSYREIARRLRLQPDEILFLSDVPAELDAAVEAGCQAIQVNRENKATLSDHHPVVESFDEINLPVGSGAN